MRILRETRPDIDFNAEKKLVTNNVLDSFDMITIVGEINDAFDIYVNAGDLQPEHFDSVASIWKLIQSYQAKI